MSLTPGQGVPGPNWASLGNDSDHKKPRIPWPEQASHKIWILRYRKFKLQQQNIDKARENRIYLLPKDNTPILTGYAEAMVPTFAGSKVKPEDYQRNDYNCVFPGWRGIISKLTPMTPETTNMKITI